jgi:hypothetical protein
VAQVVDSLLRNHEVLSSNPSTAKKNYIYICIYNFHTTPEYIPEGTKVSIQYNRDACIHMFITEVFTIARLRYQSSYPSTNALKYIWLAPVTPTTQESEIGRIPV